MKLLQLLLAAVLAAAVVPASAQRMPVPIVNHEQVLVSRPDGRPASAEEVKKAILAASQATERKWSVAEPRPGVLVATYHVRTHTVVVEIRYAGSHFSVSYKDSVNMKYGPGPEGKGVIHPFYNRWVQEFLDAIRAELART